MRRVVIHSACNPPTDGLAAILQAVTLPKGTTTEKLEQISGCIGLHVGQPLFGTMTAEGGYLRSRTMLSFIRRGALRRPLRNYRRGDMTCDARKRPAFVRTHRLGAVAVLLCRC